MQTDVIRRISIEATQKGVAETTAALKGLSNAQDGIVSSSERSEKSSLSVAAAFERQQRSLDIAYRSTQQFEKAQRALDQALQQGLVTGARHAELSALNTTRHDQQTNATKALGVITSDLNNRIQASAGSFGVLGQALSALGPVGVGVAATIGLIIGTLYAASSAAHALAEKAKEIREFSEATGLTTTQFQALRSEAGKFGIDSETLSHGLSKFTAGYDELRKGGGALLTDIRKINPALADQMQVATDSATAFTLFGKAVQQTDNIFQRNALLKAGLGKGSAIFGSFFESAPDVAALSNAFAAAGKGLDENLIKKLAVLNAEIAKTQSAANTVFASMFAESVLTSEKQFAGVMLDIAKAIKSISETKFPEAPDWVKTALANAGKVALNAVPIVGPAVTAVGGLLSAGRAAVGAGAAAYDAKQRAIYPAGGDPMTASTYGGGTPYAGGKTTEALAADLKNLVSVLGSAATPSERLAANIAELGIKAKEAGIGADVLARGVAGLKLDDAISRQSAHNATLGAAASVTDIMKEKTLALAKARQQDSTITDAQAANVMRVAKEQALGTYQIQTQIDAEKVRSATLFMGVEAATAYATSQSLINKAIQDGKPLTDDEIAKIKEKAAELAKLNVANSRTDDLMKTAQQSGAQFSTDLISGLGQGLTAVESLHAAFKNLASTLTSSAMKSLFDGDFISAGIKGIAAIAAAIFSANTSSSGEKWLKQQQDAMATRMADYQGRITLAGVDTSTRAGAILAQDQQFIRERIQENKDGGQAMNTLLQAQVDERNALLKDWDQKDTDLVKANADAKLAIEKAAADRSLGFQNRLFAATNDFDTLEGQLAAFDRAAQQERITEVQNGGQAIVDLEAAQAAERYNVIKAYNDKTIQSLNAAAKTTTDYINNLVSGPNSTQSPTVTLASAKTLYDANTALAQTGNVDAQSKWASLADNYEKALRAVFASGEGYQTGRNQIINQGLNLPAVQTTTDPVTAAVRDAITAIQIGNAALAAANGLTTNTILPAVNAGNAVAVANSLSTYLNAINATAALGTGPATASALTALFNQIDPSGKLAAVVSNTLDTSNRTANISDYTLATVTNTLGTSGGVATNNTLTGTGNSTLAAIQGLQSTATDQLGLLRLALAPTTVVVGPTITSTGAPAIGTPATQTQNQLVAGINKIVYNTAVIAHNTSLIVPQTGGSGPGHIDGVFAQGGIIPAYGLGLVSEHLNPTFLRAGPEPITVSPFPAQIPFNDNRPINVAPPVFRGGAGNDNGNNAALLARIDKLTEQVEKLQNIVSGSDALTRRTIEENGDKVAGKFDEQTVKLGSQQRQSDRQRKVANG